MGDWWFVAGAVVWVVALMYVYWPALRYPVFTSNSNIDSAFFAYAGSALRKGAVPYLSFWDHKPPLVYVIDAVALTLSGGRVWGIWLASVGALIASVFVGHRAMRLAFGIGPAAVGLVVFAASITLILASNLTEEYALPVSWAAALVVVRATTYRPNPFLTGMLLGLLGGVAFFLRANLIGAALSAVIALTIVFLLHRDVTGWLQFALGGLLGAAAVTGAVLIPLARAHALGAFWEEAFRYNFLYARARWGLRLRAAMAGLQVTTTYASVLLPLAGWIAALVRLWTRRTRDPQFGLFLFGAVWLPVEVLLASTSGREYTHYFAELLPPLAFLSALAVATLAARLGSVSVPPGRRWVTGALLVIATSIALPAFAWTVLRLRDRESPEIRSEQVAATVQYIRTHSAPNSPLLVWGHAADVYFFSDRPPASRYVYPLALLTPGYADTAMVQRFIGDVRASSPPLIIDATAGVPASERLVPSLVWNPAWRYPADANGANHPIWWSMTPALKEFYDYVATHYVLVDHIGAKRWPVYRRVSVLPSERCAGSISCLDTLSSWPSEKNVSPLARAR